MSITCIPAVKCVPVSESEAYIFIAMYESLCRVSTNGCVSPSYPDFLYFCVHRLYKSVSSEVLLLSAIVQLMNSVYKVSPKTAQNPGR